jgi:hypothetical protein
MQYCRKLKKTWLPSPRQEKELARYRNRTASATSATLNESRIVKRVEQNSEISPENP